MMKNSLIRLMNLERAQISVGPKSDAEFEANHVLLPGSGQKQQAVRFTGTLQQNQVRKQAGSKSSENRPLVH